MCIIIYRNGLRRNNKDALNSARRRFRSIWFARRHPVYQLIEFSDTLDRIHYPEDIQQHVDITDSFTVSGDDTSGESGDFVLENVNKEVKRWLPAKPTEKHWIRSCNNYGKLSQVSPC